MSSEVKRWINLAGKRSKCQNKCHGVDAKLRFYWFKFMGVYLKCSISRVFVVLRACIAKNRHRKSNFFEGASKWLINGLTARFWAKIRHIFLPSVAQYQKSLSRRPKRPKKRRKNRPKKAGGQHRLRGFFPHFSRRPLVIFVRRKKAVS